jgi:hypothetical protein
MRLVCATEQWLGKYQDLAFQRNLGYKPWPSRMALLVAEGMELIAGVMVYDSTGPFLFFEHLITNGKVPSRTRWAAVSLMAEEMMTMCRHFGKVPQVTVRHKGIKKILKRAGLVSFGADVMTCGFERLETNDYQKLPYFAPQHPHRGEDSAATQPSHPGDPEDCSGVYAEVL